MENDHICLKVLENKVLLVFVGRVNIAGADCDEQLELIYNTVSIADGNCPTN